MFGCAQQWRVGIIGDADGYRAGFTRSLNRAKRIRGFAAGSDANHHIMRVPIKRGKASRTSGGIIFGIFNGSQKGRWPASNQKAKPVFWPVKGWWQFSTILNPNPRRRASTHID